MDLLWRVVCNVLMNGRSADTTAAIDPDTRRLVIMDRTNPLEPRRARAWARLGRNAPSVDARGRIDAAIATRDLHAMRHDFAVAVHRCCESIRIVSQEEPGARSVRAYWVSSEHAADRGGAAERVAVMLGAPAPFARGTLIHVKVHGPEVARWLPNFFLMYPFVRIDRTAPPPPPSALLAANATTTTHQALFTAPTVPSTLLGNDGVDAAMMGASVRDSSASQASARSVVVHKLDMSGVARVAASGDPGGSVSRGAEWVCASTPKRLWRDQPGDLVGPHHTSRNGTPMPLNGAGAGAADDDDDDNDNNDRRHGTSINNKRRSPDADVFHKLGVGGRNGGHRKGSSGCDVGLLDSLWTLAAAALSGATFSVGGGASGAGTPYRGLGVSGIPTVGPSFYGNLFEFTPPPNSGGRRMTAPGAAVVADSGAAGDLTAGGGAAVTLLTPDARAKPTISAAAVSHGAAAAALAPSLPPKCVCVACGRWLPSSNVMQLEACGHVACYGCTASCAAHFALALDAQPSLCRCPAEGCDGFFAPREVRELLPADDYEALEFNEVRAALASAVTCPNCAAIFDGEKQAAPPGDPLEFRFECGFCHTQFCALCGAAPFHLGRPCADAAQPGQPLCRYCRSPAASLSPPVCNDPACVAKSERACTASKECGHLCHGTLGEHTCVPCLEPECVAKLQQQHQQQHHGGAGFDVTKDDVCAICYCDSLAEWPCLELSSCGHIFHTHCIEERLKRRWTSATISYAFLDCPLCAAPIAHHLLTALLQPLHRARDALEARYVERLRLEGLLTHPDIASNEASPYFNSPVAWARANLTYYECRRCKRPYFGGLRECAALLIDDGGGDGGAALGGEGGHHGGGGNEEDRGSRDDLICGGCVAVEGGVTICATHGALFAEYKCKYCCNMAVWYCWGTTHFCDLCHTPPRKSVREECKGEELCPLRARHPPNGVEFMAGCSACRVMRIAGGADAVPGSAAVAAVPPPMVPAVAGEVIHVDRNLAANPLAPQGIPAH